MGNTEKDHMDIAEKASGAASVFADNAISSIMAMSRVIESQGRIIRGLRAVLEEVEWIKVVGEFGERLDYCPWCKGGRSEHKFGCSRQLILGLVGSRTISGLTEEDEKGSEQAGEK